MREIKFRGKNIITRKWIYGYFVKTKDGYCWIIPEPEGYPYYTAEEMPRMAIKNAFEVYPATVGQYTGLKDKNGKEIYEGDIVKLGNEDICIIKYFAEYKYPMYYAESINRGSIYYFLGGNFIEVIGNIYDNPELLKGGNK